MVDKKEIKILSKEDIEKKKDKGAFIARAILEMMGKPKEHIEETLQLLLKKISDDERFGIIEYSFEETEKMEDSELYTTFAEVEFTSKDATTLMDFVIDYTPASVEVLEPSSLQLQANYFSNMMTELVGRLHMIDGEFRKLVAKNQVLSQSLGIMIQNSILIFLNLGPKTKDKISEIVGVKEEQVLTFLDKLIKEEKIIFNESDKTYRLVKK